MFRLIRWCEAIRRPLRRSRRERTEDTGQTLLFWRKERVAFLHHSAEHSADLCATRRQMLVLILRDVAARVCEIERRIRFVVLAVRVSQLAEKMRFVRRFAHASRKLRQTDLEDLRI